MTTEKASPKKSKKKPSRKSVKKQAKPSPPVEIVTQDSTKGISLLSRPEAAELDAGITKDFADANKSLIAGAIKLDRFIAGQGWKALGFLTMTEWREKKANFSTFYNARSAMKLLDGGVDPKQIEQLNLTNINELVRKLPPSRWTDPQILKLAAGPVATFERFINQEAEAAGTQVEEYGVRSFSAPKSLLENWDLAMKVAEKVNGCERPDQKVEALVAAYLNSPSCEVGFTKLQLYYQYEPSAQVA